MLVKSGYAHSGGDAKEYREYTVAELKAVRVYDHIKVIDLQGNWRNVRVTSIKTWKTRPNSVEVHWKYGLYEYGVTSYAGGKRSSGPALIVEA